MKRILSNLLRPVVLSVAALAFLSPVRAAVSVYPQSFEAGGWKLDCQFMDVMGSPYLLAHGLGQRVADATAVVTLPAPGAYRVWVRTRNWADGAPGRFKVAVDGAELAPTFGAGKATWGWEDGGTVTVAGTTARVRLVDLTGFDGRCAGIVFVAPGELAPTGALRIETAAASETVTADFVVVGGGVPGTCAAVAAARRGLRTVLVQDRPVLGGNTSSEIRVGCGGEARYALVKEVCGYYANRSPDTHLGDLRRIRVVQDEKNIDLRLSTRAYGVETNANGTIAAVKALDLRSNRTLRFVAPLFCDATGDGWVGYWAGADWRMGREAKGEHGESRAPDKPDGDTLGASLMWTSAEADIPVPFSAPWAEPHAQGITAVNGEWNWEYGIHRDMIGEAEHIRDRLFLAIYGAFSRAKRRPENAKRMLNFCPFLLGKRESRRLLGDVIYSERDVTEKRLFADSVVSGSWSIDLHYDDCRKGVDFLTTCRQPHFGRYWIPYRSLYSRNVANLFLAGRCFSCTHVGLGGPRVMNTRAQMGVVAGEAAALCRKYGVKPRGLYKEGHVRELQEILGGGFPGVPDAKTKDWLIVDDETKGVTFGKGWRRIANANGEQVGDITHAPQGAWNVNIRQTPGLGDVVYPLPVKARGRYALYGRVPWQPRGNPGSATWLEIESEGRTRTTLFNQGLAMGEWRPLGTFTLAPGAKLRLVGSKSHGTVLADGFGLKPLPPAARTFSMTCAGDTSTVGSPGLVTYRIPLARLFAEKGWDVTFTGDAVSPESGTDAPYVGRCNIPAEELEPLFKAAYPKHVADVVLLSVAHHHHTDEKPVPGIVAALRRMALAARAANPRVTVLLACPTAAGKLPKYAYLPEAGKAIARLADELDTPVSRVRAVDFASGYDWRTDSTETRVHPNAAGAGKIAARIVAALEALPVGTERR